MFLKSLRVDSLLSFAPGSSTIDLLPLNVLIGPNASGKSNLIEAVELLRSTPTGFASAIRDGGGVREWLWKGDSAKTATLDARLCRGGEKSELRYRLEFTAAGDRVEVTDEALEEADKHISSAKDVYFYYRFQKGHPVLNVASDDGTRVERKLQRDSLVPDASVLSQRKEPDLYPELAWAATSFLRIQTFREWSFGRYAAVRQPQPATAPTDVLAPDASNLGLILNQIEHSNQAKKFHDLLKRFLPRFERVSTLTQGGTIQFFLHEDDLKTPVPATRLSDGTIRFLAMSAILLHPSPPPLVCIEEPELGLHPDALSIVADLLVDASKRTQLIVTTHSDALLSYLSLQPESVLVCENIGGTQVRRLKADDLESWLEKYRLGEVWRMGAIGGNP
ncbi:MAG TPA: chromosome segregation protein SMC [Myxococcales bacterium]|nr:chromosome segregation protein SMC [Myxococcales bacterium]